MKQILPLILIVSLLTVAFLGSALMQMDQNHGGGCIASEVEGKDCPTNIIAFTFHHMEALQSILISLTAPIYSVSLMLSLLSLMSVFVLFFSKNSATPNLLMLRERLRELEIHYSFCKQKIFSWLSLFELSPAT